MLLKIITNPNPILREKAREITKEELESEKIQKLILDMGETMKKANGIGLAAPQINESLQIICIDIRECDPNGSIRKKISPSLTHTSAGGKEISVLINPRITWSSIVKNIMEEGCLSIPGINKNVKRPKNVRVKCLNAKGEKIKFKATELFARVLQHEIDHLEGILFIDRIS